MKINFEFTGISQIASFVRLPIVRMTLLALVVCGCMCNLLKAGDAPTSQPYGMTKRVPWTASRVHGSPEAPDPYLTERIFPNIAFTKPLDIAYAAGVDRVFVLQQEGLLLSFLNRDNASKVDPVIDLKSCNGVTSSPDFQNLNAYGVVFDPDFQTNHYCYICYVIGYPYKQAADYAVAYPQNKDASRLSRFVVSSTNPPTIDPKSEKILLTWPGAGHNGGCLKFGPDGYLYVSTGDNGDPNPPDPFHIAQNVGDLRSKILRIDVRKSGSDKPYAIPSDNPFVKTPGARGEVYAYGLRNPWRITFDRVSGDLWAGDVGWELWESVCHIVSGGNYGWSITEGPQPVYPNAQRGPTPIIPPDVALSHTEAASLTDGYTYHGKRLPGLVNYHIFGDWETRRLWAAPFDGKKLGKHRTISQTALRIVAFGEDAAGELSIVDYEGGGLWRISPNPKADVVSSFPRLLSETGLFADVATQTPATGVIPFSINTPQWVDGSVSKRFIAIPGEGNVEDHYEERRSYPKDTVLVRTLALPAVVGNTATSRNIETQLLHFDGRQWHGYTYQWNESGSDASLVGGNGRDIQLTVMDPTAPDGRRRQTWHFNSRAQCMTCHTTWTSYALAFNEPQLDRTRSFKSSDGVVTDNQVRAFRNVGLLPYPLPPRPRKDGTYPPPVQPVVLIDPYDGHYSIEERARSYLHVNCSVCHRMGGGGTALFDVTRNSPLRGGHLTFNAMLGTFGLPDADVISPGDPSRSVLYYRMAKSGTGRMPHLGANVTDDRGLILIGQWISGIKGKSFTETSALTAKQCADLNAAIAVIEADASAPEARKSIETLLATPQGAVKLLAGFMQGRLDPALRSFAASRAAASPIEAVRDLFSRFSDSQQAAGDKVGTSPDVASLLALAGDAERGRKVFFETASGLCSKCHVIDNQGADIGPNLSKIAAKYNKADLLDNILHPSKTIAQGYETYVIKTKTDVLSALVVSRSGSETVVKDVSGKLIHIPAADIEQIKMQPISMMPEGLLAELQPQQVADLLEFLAGRK